MISLIIEKLGIKWEQQQTDHFICFCCILIHIIKSGKGIINRIEKEMNMESWPDELFLDLFEFLGFADLLRAFRNLNHRFDKLLFTHFRTSAHFDFQSMSINDLRIICDQHLPLTINRLISLHLFNSDRNLVFDVFVYLLIYHLSISNLYFLHY